MTNEIAILMAAGMGTRMRPLTENMPKPLVKVNGIPMIETVIEALKHRGVAHIFVVTGYLNEQFSYLKNKYQNLDIVLNKDFRNVNNISSIRAVTDKMRGHSCFICEADLYVTDAGILDKTHSKSCYYGIMVRGYSDDWVFEQDNNGRIMRVGKGGDDCYNMCGISYFLEEDAAILADAIDERYKYPGYEELFWDEVVDSILDKLDMEVYPIEQGSIIEIDTVEELKKIDRTYA